MIKKRSAATQYNYSQAGGGIMALSTFYCLHSLHKQQTVKFEIYFKNLQEGLSFISSN